jgi:PAS domain S-box-containing protein
VAAADGPAVDPRFSVRFRPRELLAIKHVAKLLDIDTSQAIREAVDLYVVLFGPWPGFVFRENRTFTIQFVNQPALDLLGYSFEELFGTSMIDAYAPEMRERLDIVKEFMSEGGVRGIPIRVRKKSGESAPMVLYSRREHRAAGGPVVIALWLTEAEAERWYREPA